MNARFAFRCRRLLLALALVAAMSSPAASATSVPQATSFERKPGPMPGDPDMPDWGLRRGGTSQQEASPVIAPSTLRAWLSRLFNGGWSER
jgi:hypothetical protein